MNLTNSTNTTLVMIIIITEKILTARIVLYAILQALQVLAIPCYLFLFYHFSTTSTLRRALNSHVIILLLVVNFITLTIDLSSLLNYMHTGSVRPATPSFCLFWRWIATICYNLDMWLMSWASLERHILVFHRDLLITTKQRVMVHYIPLVLCIVYPCIYSSYIVFGYPCENVFDYTLPLCDFSCAYDDIVLAGYDTIANSIVTLFLIVLCSFSLFFRVLWQKRHLRQALQWRKNRKMVVQLLSISSLYSITIIPITVVNITGYPSEDTVAYTYLASMTYLVCCLLPFVCLSCLPELWQKLNVLRFRRRAIAPTMFFRTVTMTNRALPRVQ